jgi:hypothetical protein
LATVQPEGIFAGADDQTGDEMTWIWGFGASTHPDDCDQPLDEEIDGSFQPVVSTFQPDDE